MGGQNAHWKRIRIAKIAFQKRSNLLRNKKMSLEKKK